MIAKIRRSLYLIYLTQVYMWKIQFAYRLQAIFWSGSFAFQAFLNFVFVAVIYQVSTGIPGWSYPQMLALSALTIMIGGIVRYFVDIYDVSQNLLTGDFDTFLVKPVPNYIPFMSTFNGSATAISSVVSGLIIFAYAASQMSFSAVQFAEFALVFALGSVIAVLFTLVFIMISYKFFRSAGWVNWAFDIFQRVVRYPLNIYGVIGSLIFTFLIPLGFATYYPAELLNGMVGAWWIAGIVVFSLVLIYLLVRTFNSSFESYSSAMG